MSRGRIIALVVVLVLVAVVVFVVVGLQVTGPRVTTSTGATVGVARVNRIVIEEPFYIRA